MPDKTNRKMQYLEESFETLTCLGDGSDKEVFLVKRKDSGKIYVKKYVSSEAAEVCSRLEGVVNRNMVRIHAVAQDEKQGLVIEEFINGVTLEEYGENRGILSEERVCDIVSEICNALFEIHNRGIVHRDIKPANVMVSNDGVIKLIDFGIARSMKAGKRQDTEILGTAGYAAPEQFGYRQTDAMADVYAVGVLMNKLLTGELPTQHLYGGPALQKVIRQCIEMDAENRFQTIQELKSTLEEFLARKSGLPERQAHVGVTLGQVDSVRKILPQIPLYKDVVPKEGDGRKARKNQGCVIRGIPGFRTGVLWKNVVATIGYAFMILCTVIPMQEYTSSVEVFMLEALSQFLCIWAATLVLFNVADWDRKFFLTCRFPKAVTLVFRILLWIFIFNMGIVIENHVKYDILGMVRPQK